MYWWPSFHFLFLMRHWRERKQITQQIILGQSTRMALSTQLISSFSLCMAFWVKLEKLVVQPVFYLFLKNHPNNFRILIRTEKLHHKLFLCLGQALDVDNNRLSIRLIEERKLLQVFKMKIVFKSSSDFF